MKFLLPVILAIFVCYGCGTSDKIAKGADPGVDMVASSQDGKQFAKASHERPADIPQLIEVLGLTDLETIEFKKIYKTHANQVMLVNASDRDHRGKLIERKKIIESRDRMVMKMLDGRQRKIYIDFLSDLAKREKMNSKDGQNDKM